MTASSSDLERKLRILIGLKSLILRKHFLRIGISLDIFYASGNDDVVKQCLNICSIIFIRWGKSNLTNFAVLHLYHQHLRPQTSFDKTDNKR